MTNLTQIPQCGPTFNRILADNGLPGLSRAPIRELQINVGKLCNQACNHCHVDAGPKRTELMTWTTMQNILEWSRGKSLTQADITGGAPELNPHFRKFVLEFLSMDMVVTSRCNLTVLFEPGQDDLAEWYSSNRVRLVCSLPCYSKDNVDAQRGKGVFQKSIAALQKLNEHGYGKSRHLPLDLVYNPNGAFLPPAQQQLEADYREKLYVDFGIEFSSLLTITNLPINRFAHFLKTNDLDIDYQTLLVENFNPSTVEALMCRHLISVDWRGQVYDCDFNQMLELPFNGKSNPYLWELNSEELKNKPIAVGRHCFGCTAGAGSSCGGALV